MSECEVVSGIQEVVSQGTLAVWHEGPVLAGALVLELAWCKEGDEGMADDFKATLVVFAIADVCHPAGIEMPLHQELEKQLGFVSVDVQSELDDSVVFPAEFVGLTEVEAMTISGDRQHSFNPITVSSREYACGLSRLVRVLDQPQQSVIEPGLGLCFVGVSLE